MMNRGNLAMDIFYALRLSEQNLECKESTVFERFELPSNGLPAYG